VERASGKPDLLVVDDDPLISDTLNFVLSRDFSVYVAESRAQVKSLLRQLDNPPQLALIDLGLPPTPHRPDEGFKLINELIAYSPSIKILVLSGQNDETNARHARTLGAIEFIAKPCEPEKIKELLLKALQIRDAEITAEAGEGGLVGKSLLIEKLRQQISQYANAPFPVLIEGESGSGKELVALSLHRGSSRAAKPYLALNCAAIAPTLVEATLFGYAKGAFTGAGAAKAGYFEDAQEGTLFLDEIGELPLEMQAKLLRVLENGEFQRLGETMPRVSRARVLAATNRDLRQAVRDGRFRADLFHRLSVLSLAVPPLREMEGDKELLLEHFRKRYAAQSGAQPFELEPAARERWLRYPFPGNVRELRNIAIRLTAKHGGQRVSLQALESELDLEAPLPGGAAAEGALVEHAQRLLEQASGFSLDDTLKAWERAYIDAALRLTRGNVSQAAKLLGVNRTTLYSRMNSEGEK